MLLVLGLAGCQSDEPPKPAFANWPAALNDFRFRWAAEPGVDLASGPAVPLRAYLESYRIAQLTQNVGAAYPGFDRAVPQRPSDSDAPAELLSIRPSPDVEWFGPPGPFYGNGMKLWRVEFTDAPPAANAPAEVTDQSGPNPAPIGDVFGPWRITGANDVHWGSLINRKSTSDERMDGARRISQCSDLLPHWRTERDANIAAVLDSPPAPEPASPGWPEAS